MMGFFALAVILIMVLHAASIPQLDFTRAFSGLRDFLKNSRNLAGVFIVVSGLAAFAIYYLGAKETRPVMA